MMHIICLASLCVLVSASRWPDQYAHSHSDVRDVDSIRRLRKRGSPNSLLFRRSTPLISSSRKSSKDKHKPALNSVGSEKANHDGSILLPRGSKDRSSKSSRPQGRRIPDPNVPNPGGFGSPIPTRFPSPGGSRKPTNFQVRPSNSQFAASVSRISSALRPSGKFAPEIRPSGRPVGRTDSFNLVSSALQGQSSSKHDFNFGNQPSPKPIGNTADLPQTAPQSVRPAGTTTDFRTKMPASVAMTLGAADAPGIGNPPSGKPIGRTASDESIDLSPKSRGKIKFDKRELASVASSGILIPRKTYEARQPSRSPDAKRNVRPKSNRSPQRGSPSRAFRQESGTRTNSRVPTMQGGPSDTRTYSRAPTMQGGPSGATPPHDPRKGASRIMTGRPTKLVNDYQKQKGTTTASSSEASNGETAQAQDPGSFSSVPGRMNDRPVEGPVSGSYGHGPIQPPSKP